MGRSFIGDLGTRTLSLLALDQVAAGYREVASITIIMITVSPWVWRSLARPRSGLKVGHPRRLNHQFRGFHW